MRVDVVREGITVAYDLFSHEIRDPEEDESDVVAHPT